MTDERNIAAEDPSVEEPAVEEPILTHRNPERFATLRARVRARLELA